MIRDLSLALKRYQQCIGAYDQHDWERSVEQKLLEGLGGPVPKKTVKLLPQLIDVDLIRGSPFGKAKPLLGFVGVTWLGVKAAVFFPLWWKWWVKHIGTTLVRLVLLAYALQIGILAHYLGRSSRGNSSTIESTSKEDDSAGTNDEPDCNEPGLTQLTGTEVGSCVILMISLSVLHAHMTSTQRQPSPASGTSTSPVSESSASSSSGCSSTGCWSTPYQTSANNSTTGSCAKKNVRQKPSNLNLSASRWRRAISEDPASFRPRAPSVVRENAKETFSGDEEEEDEAEDEDEPGSETVKRSGSKKARLKTSRQLLRIRRKSCGTMTQATTDIDGDVDKNSSCDSSECPSSFSVRSPVPDSTTNVCEAPAKAGSQQRREKEVSGSASKARPSGGSVGGSGGRSNATLEVDYWSGATTNSEEDCCNCTSTELDDDDEVVAGGIGSGKRRVAGAEKPTKLAPGINSSAFFQDSLFFPFDYSGAVSVMKRFSPDERKLSCMIWGGASGEAHKADLSVLDISSAIVRKVEFSSAWDSADYLRIGIVLSSVLALVPAIFRLLGNGVNWTDFEGVMSGAFMERLLSFHWLSTSLAKWHSAVLSLCAWMFRFSPLCMLVLLRFILAFLTFFLLSVAERTFKRRYMLAKMFHCLTSARRAKRWDLPHFRLSKVRNIKSWLSVRSYLKRHGPQRSVDVIVSAAFLATLALMTGICADMLRSGNGKDSDKGSSAADNGGSSPDPSSTSGPVLVSASTIAYTDAVVWCLGLALFLLRYMTLGVKINSKYRDISVLITEQINLYLRMEQKPHKKDQLILANNVLKLAADLIKELESPFKISGLSANPILYNVTKMVVLSAFSAVLTEMLGFKLKLYKLKFKA